MKSLKSVFKRICEKMAVHMKMFCFFSISIFIMLNLNIKTFAGNNTIEFSINYGYENTAKAGKILPIDMNIKNNSENTFVGTISIYSPDAIDSMNEYRYRVTVEGNSSKKLSVGISSGRGTGQLLFMARDRNDEVLGMKKIGLDLAVSDAELIIGVISESPEKLSYLNAASVNNGLLRSRSININPRSISYNNAKLDELDIIVISDLDISLINKVDIENIKRWVEHGGVLIIGTGEKGKKALNPYFDYLLKKDLETGIINADAFHEFKEGSFNKDVSIAASAVYLKDGRELFFNDKKPMLSLVNDGMGIIAVCGYDLCDIQKYLRDDNNYVDIFLSSVIGHKRLEKFSVPAGDKCLEKYRKINELMKKSDIKKLPKTTLYVIVFILYIIIIGPFLYSKMRKHNFLAVYRTAILIVSVFFSIIIYIMGYNTRFNGKFLNYVMYRDISKESVNETAFINLRSPYKRAYGMNLRTEYFIYPLFKGSDYAVDIKENEINKNTLNIISSERNINSIKIENQEAFEDRYFEIKNKKPNTDEGFESDLSFFDGKLKGRIYNKSAYELNNAVLLLYGRLVYIGDFPRESYINLENYEIAAIPPGVSSIVSNMMDENRGSLYIKYYLDENLNSYFENAELIGTVKDDKPVFTDDDIEYYGVSVLSTNVKCKKEEGNIDEYSILRRDPQIMRGDYSLIDNTIGGTVPVVIEYYLGEDEEIKSLNIESYNISEEYLPEDRHIFDASMSFYDYEVAGYKSISLNAHSIDEEELKKYLSPENVLRVRYIPSNKYENTDIREYLPLISVKAENIRKNSEE